MRYLVRVNELNQKIDYLTKQIAIIDENIDALSKLKASIIWNGEAAQLFMNNYDKYLYELDNIRKGFVLITEYLSSYQENYGSTYRSLRNKYNNRER